MSFVAASVLRDFTVLMVKLTVIREGPFGKDVEVYREVPCSKHTYKC